MALCNLCHEPVIWARMAETGNGVPLEPPDGRGNAWFEQGELKGKPCRVLRVASAEHPAPQGARLFRLHFIRCRPYQAKKKLERALRAAERPSA